MRVTLAEAKKHLNVDPSYTGDDVYIAGLIEVSEEAVSRHINAPLEEWKGAGGDLPAGLRHAVLFLVGQLYANREPVSYSAPSAVPYTYDYLVSLYKRYVVR